MDDDAAHARDLLLRHLAAAQDHVLDAVAGLGPDQLAEIIGPTGWSVAGMLGHLTYDDEIFWVHAILAGEADGIAAIRDGWTAEPADAAEAVDAYRSAVQRSRALLSGIDLAAPPRWWPPAEVFPMAAYGSGWQVLFHLLTEVTTHAGHLDIARESIDGHRHLVLG